MRYLLALDGGGTKTDGLLLCQQSGQRWTARAGAAQLTNDFATAIQHVRELCQQLCQQAQASPAEVSAIFGLAGAGNPQLAQAFNQAQQIPFAHWQLTTDARTSLYGANLGQPVAVVAIDTGSDGMRLQHDGTEQQVGGWGFSIGDEGGGAWLGQQLVRQLLWQLDWQRPLSPLLTAVSQQCGANTEQLLPWLKQANASDFAKLAPLVYHHQEALSQQLQQQQGAAISALAKCALAEQPLPLVLLGGLATQCQPWLCDNLQSQLQPARGDALAGGVVLAAKLATSS